jgi:hypothetical protein
MHGAGSDPSVASMPGCAGGDTTASVIVQGDAFLKDTVKKIMASPAWSEGAAIVIVWDEDDYAGTAGCCNSPVGVSVDGGAGVLGGAQVPAIVISSKISTPVMSNDPYNHYSLLATIQNLWGFGCLANTCGMSLTTDDEALRAVRA